MWYAVADILHVLISSNVLYLCLVHYSAVTLDLPSTHTVVFRSLFITVLTLLLFSYNTVNGGGQDLSQNFLNSKHWTWLYFGRPRRGKVFNTENKIYKYQSVYSMSSCNIGVVFLKILSKALNVLTPTHAQLYFIKKPFKKLLHVSVYDHLQGVTISSLRSQLLKHSCMYTRCGGVAAYL